MSRRNPSGRASRGTSGGTNERPAEQDRAVVFAALGDETRLALVARLIDGRPASISQLTDAQPAGGARLTRQAITKHLRVLERARIVHGIRAGRESLFALDLKPIEDLKEYLDMVSAQWDQALARLKSFVEESDR
jgi:DNA-binding transcriptional ArsR family regulator